jgi:hypothetical protein
MADMFNQYFVRGPKPEETNETIKRYIAMMDDDVVKGSFFFSALFMYPKYSTPITPPHFHPYSEVLFFQGLNPDKPEELGWEIDLYLGEEFERQTFNKSAVVYIPAGMKYCISKTKVNHPFIFVERSTGPKLLFDKRHQDSN